MKSVSGIKTLHKQQNIGSVFCEFRKSLVSFWFFSSLPQKRAREWDDSSSEQSKNIQPSRLLVCDSHVADFKSVRSQMFDIFHIQHFPFVRRRVSSYGSCKRSCVRNK